jgi:O-antigen/teichoic acid export membrane protein
MNKRIIHDISASSLQVIINQLAGLIVFFVASRYLNKTIFGELSWALAVLMVSFAVLGGGIDQITVRKVAAGEDAASYLKIYLFHVFMTGVSFLAVLLLARAITGSQNIRLGLLLFLGIGQFFIFLSIPFKQIANGKEQFKVLLLMSTGANIVKVAGLLFLAWFARFTLSSLIFVYCLASATELLVCVYAARRFLRIPAGVRWDRVRYARLVKDALPQLGVVLCSAGIARFDWIFLGIICAAPILAEYSFAYKAFELSSLPLLILAPLLLPRITKWFGGKGETSAPSTPSVQRTEDLNLLARFEMILACSICLVLNIVWSPLIDGITDNKYGAVNTQNIFFLSCSLPFLYINNILWSVHFARTQMKFIFFVFMVTLIVTCAGDLILIPFFQGRGAAIAYLVAMIVQTVLFSANFQTRINTRIEKIWHSLALCGASALLSGYLSTRLHTGAGIQSVVSLGLYLACLVACRQIRLHDWIMCKRVMYA